MLLTDTKVRNARSQAKRYELTDSKSQGLVLRITPKGRKIWAVRYYFEGRQYRITIGVYPTCSLVRAREKAAQIQAKIQTGEDPSGKRRPIILSGETVADLIQAWRERHALVKNKPRTIQAYDGIARTIILPIVGHLRVREVRTRDLAELIAGEAARLRAKGKRGTQANRAKALLTKIFKLACQWGWIDANPASSLSSPVPEKARNRFLSMDEIKTLWVYLDKERTWFSAALRLLLISGQRPGEVISARLSDFNFAQGLWTIPDTKRNVPHIVPITMLAKRTIHSVADSHESTLFLFPGRTLDCPLGRTTLSKATQRFCQWGRVLPEFTPNDLRRTVTTHMRRLGIAPHIVNKVQGRIEQTVQARHYDRYDYLREKVDALTLWTEELQRAVEPWSKKSKPRYGKAEFNIQKFMSERYWPAAGKR